jgi:putative inorganic carbon (HCO3(-)) transporter
MVYFLIILFVLFAILAWRNLKLALVVLTGLLPIYLLRFNVGPIPTTALEVLLLICAVVWLIRFTHPDANLTHPDTRRDLLAKTSYFVRPTILLIAAASFGVVVAPDTFSALGIWKAYFIEPILVAIMMLTSFDRDDWSNALRALSISAIALSIFAIVQYFTGMGIPAPWDIELRVTSVFDYPNALGLFLAPIVSFNLILLFLCKQESIIYRAISISTIILGFIAIILAQTEAALIAIPAAVLLTLLMSQISKTKKIIVLILLTILACTTLMIPITRDKLLFQDYSGQVRLSQWSETIALLKDHPFFGAGLNSYPEALAPYHNPTLYEIFQYPHNILLNTWTELGLLGVIALIWFGFLIIKDAVNHRNLAQLAILAALLTMFIHGLVDVPYFKNDLSVMTWIFLSAFIAVNIKRKKT